METVGSELIYSAHARLSSMGASLVVKGVEDVLYPTQVMV